MEMGEGRMMTASAAAMEGNAKAAGTRRTKLVRVKQEYIDCVLKQREVRPRRPFSSKSVELLSKVYRDQPEKLEQSLNLWAQAATTVQMMHDKEEDILEQYRSMGYAMEEIELDDDDVADV